MSRDERIEAAFRAISTACDEAWKLWREASAVVPPALIDTLSSSLAQPRDHQLEMMLSKARTLPESKACRKQVDAEMLANGGSR